MTFYVFYMLVGNLIIGPLMNILDPFYLWRLVKQYYARKRLGDDTLHHYNQKELNATYEPPDMCLYLRYCNIIRTFLVSVFFFEICPIGMPICLLFLIVQFWVDKIMILRRYKRIPRFHPKLAHELNEIAEYCIFLLAAGSWVFKWRAFRTVHFVDICCLVVGFFFLIFSLKTFVQPSKQKDKVIEEYNEHNFDRSGHDA